MKPLALLRAASLTTLLSGAAVCAGADNNDAGEKSDKKILAAKADKPAKMDKQARQNPPVDPYKPVDNPAPVDLSQPLSLDQALKIGLQNQNTLGIAQNQVEAARARVTQSRGSYYPQIAPSYSYSSQVTTQRFNGVTQTGTVESGVTQIAARQLIFDMGKREENVLISKYNARSAELNVLDTRQVIISNISTAYFDLMRQKELVKVAEANAARAKTTLEYTQAAADAGTVARKDILQAQADLDNALVSAIIARNNVRLAQTTLKSTMGVLSSEQVLVPDAAPDAPSATPDPLTAADYTKLAFDARPDLKREVASIDANRHNVKIANIEAGFQVQADITEGYRIDPVPGENRSFNTTFSYPLFDGGSTRAAVRQAKANLEQSRRQLDLTRQNVQLDVEQSFLTREEARVRIGAAEAAVKAARLNYDAALAAQREGAVTGTILDVITAQAQLVTAETNAVQALFDFYTNDARLKRAIGKNDPYLPTGGK